MIKREKLNVKVGDQVIWKAYGYDSHLSTVEKITPKGNIRLDDGCLYTPYGERKGQATWGRTDAKIVEYKGEEKEQFFREMTVSNAIWKMGKRARSNGINYEQAVKILEILKEEIE